MGLERVGGARLSPFLSFTLLLNYSWLSSLEGTSHLSHSYWPRGPLCHQLAKCRAYSLMCFDSLMSHVQTSGLRFSRGWNFYVISTCYGNMDNKPTANVMKNKQEEICSFETSVPSYQTRRRHDPEQHNVNIALCLFLLLHRACCRVTQLLHQSLHIYKIYKIYTLKHSKMLRHVSILEPSSGSYIFLAKVTVEIVTDLFRCTSWVLWQHPTTHRPTTATNHIQQNQRSTPRAVTHVLVSWRWA